MHRATLFADFDMLPRDFTIDNARSYVEIAFRARFASEEFFEDVDHPELKVIYTSE